MEHSAAILAHRSVLSAQPSLPACGQWTRYDYAGTLASCKEKAVEYSRILLQHAPLTKAQRAAAVGDEGKLQAMDL